MVVYFGGRLTATTTAWLVVLSFSLSLLEVACGVSAQGGAHDPILIDGNADFKSANGVIGGSGTALDPYIIEGWDIGGTPTENCIEIRDTTAFFVIRNCSLLVSDGIVFSNVENGTLTSVSTYACHESLRMENSTDVTVNACHFDSANCGIRINNSNRVTITNNIDTNNAWGLWIDMSSSIYFADNALGVSNVGFHLTRSSDVVCLNNSIWSLQNPAIMEHMSCTSLEGNNFTIYSGDGVHISDCDNTTVVVNYIGTIDVPSWIESWGVNVVSSDNVTIEENRIEARVTGIIIDRSINSMVVDNVISWGSMAIRDAASGSSYIFNNTVASMDNGVLATDSLDCTIWKNSLVVRNTAIALDRSNGSAVIDNSAETASFPNYAIRAGSCVDLLIWNNSRLIPSLVFLSSCVNTTITENNYSSDCMVRLDSCIETQLMNNIVSSDDTAVWVRWSTDTYIISNEFHAPNWAVKMESCHGGSGRNNSFPAETTGNGTVKYLYGFSITDSSDFVVSGNTFDSYETAVGIDYSTNITVLENDFTRSSVGIYVSPECLVMNNTFREASSIGASYDCSLTAIVGNYFPNGGVISLWDALKIGIFENIFIGGGVAIWGSDLAAYDSHLITEDNLVNGKPILQICDSSGVEIEGIEVGQLIVVNSEFVNVSGLNTSDCFIGMLLAFCSNVTIQNCTLTNDQIGLRLFYDVDVMIDHNHFITSMMQDSVYSTDTEALYNLTYPGGGNFWSAYSGVDLYHGSGQNISGPDGFGDTPYDWYGIVVDYYPIVGPFINYHPMAAFSYSPSEGDTSTVFTFDASPSHDDEDFSEALQVRWDWDGDGSWDTDWSGNMTAEHSFTDPGSHIVRLEVRDSFGATNTTELQVEIVETIPEFSDALFPAFALILLMAGISMFVRARRR